MGPRRAWGGPVGRRLCAVGRGVACTDVAGARAGRGELNGNFRHGLRTMEAEAEQKQAKALLREAMQQLKRM